VYWNHPAVAGITLWGYVEGATWAEGTGILNSNGTERSAMTWLKEFTTDLPTVGYPFGIDTTTTNVEEIEKLTSISVFPNPVVSGEITIENHSQELVKSIQIIDLQGRILKTVSTNSVKSEINIGEQMKGMYYLRIETDNSVETRKIIIL
jgi:flagellar hook assembly protein FlgD